MEQDLDLVLPFTCWRCKITRLQLQKTEAEAPKIRKKVRLPVQQKIKSCKILGPCSSEFACFLCSHLCQTNVWNYLDMIAEVLLILAGHFSSLFPTDHNLHPVFKPLLHPGEEQCLEALGQIAFGYRNIKKVCTALSRSNSRYICALCTTLNQILKDEYEGLESRS